jgi:hypothetical protein
MENDKTYIAITGLGGEDKILILTQAKRKKFENKFGNFNNDWKDNHEEALEWLIVNCKFFNYCTVLS